MVAVVAKREKHFLCEDIAWYRLELSQKRSMCVRETQYVRSLNTHTAYRLHVRTLTPTRPNV